jgi:hypothetical protein
MIFCRQLPFLTKTDALLLRPIPVLGDGSWAGASPGGETMAGTPPAVDPGWARPREGSRATVSVGNG